MTTLAAIDAGRTGASMLVATYGAASVVSAVADKIDIAAALLLSVVSDVSPDVTL